MTIKLRLPGEWERVGRGHALEFYASDEEVGRFIDLARENASDIVLVGTQLVRTAKGYRTVAHTVTVLSEAIGQGTWSFYLAPEAAVEAVNAIASPADAEGALSLTGFISLQHGGERDGRRVASSISLVSRVRNIDTGEQVHTETSLEQFRRLKRIIQKELRYGSVQNFPNGQRSVDDKLALMTSEACALAKSGFFDRDCGPPI